MSYYVSPVITRAFVRPLPPSELGASRGFSRSGLGAVVPLSRMATGIGAFMWSDFRRGLGQADPTEGGECPQPVPTAERDALRNRIREYTNPSEAIHFHEGHPDLKAIWNDAIRRLHGLEFRPKLLRCSNEARSRAQIWMDQLDALERKVKQRGIGKGFQASLWVRVTEPIQFTLHRGPTYTIRPGTPHPEAFAGQAAAPPAAGPVESSAPPGSVVVGGQAYPSSAAAEAAQKEPVQTVGGEDAWEPSAGAPGAFLQGELIPGVPNTYLLLGGGALLAYRMLKGR